MDNYYEMTIAGLTRQLPLCKVNDNMDIGAFVIFGDVELTIAAAHELLLKVPEFDYIVTPEAKGIPLGYEMARQSGKSYFVARKGKKLYMKEPFGVEVRSITTTGVQEIYLDRREAEILSGKLLEYAHANVVAECAVLAEGDAADRDDIIFLEKLPLFFKD